MNRYQVTPEDRAWGIYCKGCDHVFRVGEWFSAMQVPSLSPPPRSVVLCDECRGDTTDS